MSIANEITVIADGTQLANLGGGTFSLGNAHYKKVGGAIGITGQIKKPKTACVIEVSVSDHDDLDIEAVAGYEDIELQVEDDRGKTYLFKEACLSETLKRDVDGDSGGKWDLTFEASSYQIVGSA